jgi:hypothetical protein
VEKIKFQTNIPVEVALKFAEGKLCDSQFGDPQYMFTTVDDRVFFVAEKVAQKIHGLRLQPREPLGITKAEVDWGNGRKGIEWKVERVNPPEWTAIGEQPNGTFVVPANGAGKPGAGASTPAPVTAAFQQPSPSNGNGSKPNGTNGNGNGHAAMAAAPWTPAPLKIPLNVAVAEAVRLVTQALKDSGEQWSDQARQDLVSTVLITADKQGWLGPWQREAVHAQA